MTAKLDDDIEDDTAPYCLRLTRQTALKARLVNALLMNLIINIEAKIQISPQSSEASS